MTFGTTGLRPMCLRGYADLDHIIPMSDQDRISPYNLNTVSSR